MARQVTAGVVLIGDELLSGRTRDINLQQIATFLAPLGIQVRETRTVPDDEPMIVEAVNTLRDRYSYVFTTGGIGPTHDDITADAVAAAFGVGIGEDPAALALIADRYKETGVALTPARRRMARIPEGGELIVNAVSGAPGIRMGNVFILAGVPSIARAMLESIGDTLEGGAVVHTLTVRGTGLREGELADGLRALSERFETVDFGSYPWFSSAGYGAHLVARTTDEALLNDVREPLADIVRAQGCEPEFLEES